MVIRARQHGETRSTSEAIRAEALFASALQPSQYPSPGEVRLAVTTTLQQLGVHGCAGQLAGEFGDHPETAAARMAWALATIRAVYATPSAALGPRGLALAGRP